MAPSHKSKEQEIREMNQVLFFSFLFSLPVITTAASSSSPFPSFLPSFLAVNQQICRPLTLSLLARRAVCVTSSYDRTFPSLPCFLFLVLLPHCLPLSNTSSSPLPFTPGYPSTPISPSSSSSSSIPCSSTLHANLSKIRRVKPFEEFPLS